MNSAVDTAVRLIFGELPEARVVARHVGMARSSEPHCRERNLVGAIEERQRRRRAGAYARLVARVRRIGWRGQQRFPLWIGRRRRIEILFGALNRRDRAPEAV